ncbi:MAG: 16S rRNA processing protein RimM [Bacilli bacterium]|nr:16S rRNA processing protein RimM [Bacilli bacterium]
MEYIFIGKIVSTHGIKGEIKIISEFDFKDKAFKPGNEIYFGKEKNKFIISSYRRHKNYEMITMEGYNNINLVLPFIKDDVYILDSELNLDEDEYLDSSLLGLNIYNNDELLGEITEVFSPSPNRKVIRFVKDGKNYLVPYVKSFVKLIDLSSKKMILYSMEGVLECE